MSIVNITPQLRRTSVHALVDILPAVKEMMKILAQPPSYVCKNLYLNFSVHIQTHFSQLQINEIKIAYLNLSIYVKTSKVSIAIYLCFIFNSSLIYAVTL